VGKAFKILCGFSGGFCEWTDRGPFLPYLFSLDIGKNLFVQGINISFTLSSLVMLVGMRYSGDLPASTSLLAVGGTVPVLIVYFCREIAGKTDGNISSAVGVGIFVGNRFDFDA